MSAYTLDEQQQMLADSARAYLARSASAAPRGATAGQVAGRWADMAELGWLALPLPASAGGLAGSMADICALCEELGRGLSPAPYVGCSVLAGMLLADAADAELQAQWLPALADGTRRLAFGAFEPGERFDWTAVRMRARQEAAGWRLTGAKAMVTGGQGADAYLVAARIGGSDGHGSDIGSSDGHGSDIGSSDEMGLFIVAAAAPGLRVDAFQLYDGQGAAALQLQGAAAGVMVCRGPAATVLELIEKALARAVLAHCADTVGAMARAYEITRDYVSMRRQFGKTIAANQVVQHRLVDLYVEIEEARALNRAACDAMALQGEGAQAMQRRYVAAAKAFVSQTARHVWEESVQLHGAIGMTEECDVGAYVKRLALSAVVYGDAPLYLERLAALTLGSQTFVPTQRPLETRSDRQEPAHVH